MKKIFTVLCLMAGLLWIAISGQRVSAEESTFFYSEETKDNYQGEERVLISKNAKFDSFNSKYICEDVKEITFEEGRYDLGSYVFYYFPNVTTVHLPASWESTDTAFYEHMNHNGQVLEPMLTKLEHITIPDQNRAYEVIDDVLYDEELRTIIHYPAQKKDPCYRMPEYVQNCRRNAFGDNPYLQEIVFGTRYDFQHEDRMADYGKFSNLSKFDVACDNVYISAEDGILYDYEKTELLAYPRARIMDRFEIPSTVLEINPFSFEGAQIGTLVLPDALDMKDYSEQTISYSGYFIRDLFSNNKIGAFEILSNSRYATFDGALYNKDKSVLLAWPGKKDMKSLSFPSTLKGLQLGGDDLFPELDQVSSLVLPKSLVRLTYDGGLKSLSSIQVEQENKYFTVYDGALYSKDMKWLYMIPSKRKSSTLTFPKELQNKTDNYISVPSVTKIIVNGTGKGIPYDMFPNLKTVCVGKKNKQATAIDHLAEKTAIDQELFC